MTASENATADRAGALPTIPPRTVVGVFDDRARAEDDQAVRIATATLEALGAREVNAFTPM